MHKMYHRFFAHLSPCLRLNPAIVRAREEKLALCSRESLFLTYGTVKLTVYILVPDPPSGNIVLVRFKNT